MTEIAAGKFKNVCLRLLDEVARTRTPIVITKRGRPVAQLAPIPRPGPRPTLKGSVLTERGSPYRTGERWSAEPVLPVGARRVPTDGHRMTLVIATGVLHSRTAADSALA